MLILEPNVLVLDEPTTHLDIQSREALEEMLIDFRGTILFVTHDRHLISLLANNLWIIHDGKVDTFDGTYKEWQEYNNQKISTPPPSESKLQDQKMQIPGKGKKQKKKQPKSRIKSNKHNTKPNREEIIDRLEKRVQEIEIELTESAGDADLERIRELGIEHSKLNAKLQDALDQWVN